MSNFPQKRNVNVAAVSKRKHNLSHLHIGTTDFGRIKPIECRYMVPGDEFNINVSNETRVLNSMPSPTIGEFDVIYRSFFVPIAHVWHPFYDFLKKQQTLLGANQVDVVSAPWVSLFDLVSYFVNADNGLTEVVNMPASEDRSAWDFYTYLPEPVGGFTHFKFTRKGRILNDFLTSLGINIPYGVSDDQEDTKLYIVIPLMCFWKFYFDWIVPSRYIRDHLDWIETLISSTRAFMIGTQKVDIDIFFRYLVHEPLAYYEDDFFTTLTEFPFQGEENLTQSITLENPNGANFGPVSAIRTPNASSNGAEMSDTAGGLDKFNMYTLQTLGKLQDLLNRNLIAGTKVQDWLLTEFGLKPNNDALHLSTYLGSKRTTLSVSDVISNADTLSADGETGTPLGAYGGYIRNRQKFDFGYKAQEHGFYFITYELVPRTSYYQGLQAQFDMGDSFDFFQPEFDNQQGMPIPFRRLYFSHDNGLNQLQRFDQKFGFGLQYGDLKFAPDVISGDLRTRFGLQLKSWYLARDMSYIADANNNIEGIDEEFCLVKSDYQDWHYIFSDMKDNIDPFLVAFFFDIPAMRPMKSVVEGYEPTYQQSGKNVQIDFSGSVK